MFQNIQDRVTTITVEHLGVPPAKVTPEAKFADDLGADSLDMVELVMAFEDEFQIEIGDEQASKIETVAQAVAFVENATPQTGAL